MWASEMTGKDSVPEDCAEYDSTASFQGWPGVGGGQPQSRVGQELGASPCTGGAPSLSPSPDLPLPGSGG